MAVTEEEKKQIQAYNIGSLLSIHEPKLLEQIIKSNKNHEFVKMMATAKDHQEFYQGIPRKDHTREYKNGFYNSRALAEQSPTLLNLLLTTKSLPKDFLQGLQDGKTEYEISQVKSKIKKEPKPVTKEDQKYFIKGFNQGYELSAQHGDIIKMASDTQKKWSPYIQGLNAGNVQYLKEQQLAKNQPDKSPAPEKDRLSDEDYHSLRTNVENLKENSEGKEEMLHVPEKPEPEAKLESPTTDSYTDFSDYIPEWLRDDLDDYQTGHDEPDKDRDPDIEPEL